MATGKNITARRREVRRNLPRRGPKWLGWLRKRETAWGVFYCVVLAVLSSVIVLIAGARLPYEPGQAIPRAIVSRVAFQAIDKQATQEKQTAAKSREPNAYVPNGPYLESLRERMAGLIALADASTIEEIPPDYRSQVSLTRDGLEELQKYKSGDSARSLQQWNELSETFLQKLFSLAILSAPRHNIETRSSIGKIAILPPWQTNTPQNSLERYRNAIYSVEDTATIETKLRLEVMPFPAPLRDTVLALVMQKLQPTYVFDKRAEELTKQRQLEAFEQAGREPEMEKFVADEVLIPAGTTLSDSDIDVLKAERQAFEAGSNAMHHWLNRGGAIAMMLIIASGLWIYIAHYNPRIITNPMRGLAITLLLLLCQALAVFLTQVHPEFVYATGTFPTLLAAMILAIAYNQRFALAVGAVHAIMVTASLKLPVDFGLVLLVGVAVAVWQLGEVRSRSKIVQVGLWSGLAMAAATLAIGFADRPLYLSGEWRRLLLDGFHALLTGIGSGLLVQGILPGIEAAFHVTTAMTLKELNDASHPLLQRLAQEAPGTYQHSLRIADMAEGAADAIGADGLLCRVGSMYHDIGKINKPMYFIENQGGGPNRHTKLSPAMSLLIIVGHVKDGIEMAREYRLPATVRHFIESHHGTTLVEYFYHAARKQKEAEDAPGPSEFEFRYPGPKPQTREAAIMLLCDSLEAAARALPEPTPVRLEQLVEKIAMKRLMDGQFDECNLTLQELHRIEQAITKTLCAIYHGRIKYPGEEGGEAAEPTAATPPLRPAAS